MDRMRAVILVLVLFPGLVRADDAANRDLAVEYTRLARDAAAAGNCDVVRDLGEKIRVLDALHHATVFVTDEVIAKCLPTLSPVPQPAPVAPPPSIAPPTLERSIPVAPRDAEAPAVPSPYTRPPVPPLDGGRILGEAFVGTLLASAGVLGGGFLGLVICADDNSSEFSCLGSALIGAYAGGILGFGTGVWAVGSYGDQTGSYGGAILGGVLGGALGIGLALGLDRGGSDQLAVATIIFGPMVGSIVGFNWTRRWKHPDGTVARRRSPSSPVGSLVQLDGGRASLGMPIVVRGNRLGTPTTSFSLFSGSF